MAESPTAAGAGFRVIALIATYNEEDIIGQVVEDLIRQGVEVYLVDDGSTDDTVARVEPWQGRGAVVESRRRAASPQLGRRCPPSG